MDQEVGALQLAEDIRVEPDEIDAIRDAEPLRLLAKRATIAMVFTSSRTSTARSGYGIAFGGTATIIPA